MTGAGLAWSLLPADATRSLCRRVTACARGMVAEGRFAALMWGVSRQWHAQPPIEAWMGEGMLGDPTERGDDAFGLHAHLAVRAYGDDRIEPVATYRVLLYRRRGPLPFARKHEVGDLLDRDRLDTTRFAFTRDVANDVWHLPAEDAVTATVARLARLLIWSDERVVRITGGGDVVADLRSRAHGAGDLVGVPHKVPYEWKKGPSSSSR